MRLCAGNVFTVNKRMGRRRKKKVCRGILFATISPKPAGETVPLDLGHIFRHDAIENFI
jgi:hypothetical protein